MSLRGVGTLKPTVLSYLWEVKNVCTSGLKNGNFLRSPIFSTTYSSTEHKWLLYLYPEGNIEANKDWISLGLGYTGDSNVQVNVTLSFIDNKGCKINTRSFQRLYEKESLQFGFERYKERNFVTDKTNQILLNDEINILCEIIHDSNFTIQLKIKHVEDLSDYCRLREFDEFQKLLEAENSKDVTIRIGKDEIKVHKAIIMSRSPVFQAMFEHDMKEKDQNVVEITDIKYEVMKEVFRFMYVGKVNELKKLASDLLITAEKYSIMGLKVLTEKHLFENLTVSNAIDYVKLADMCNSINLKSKIIQFMICNQKEIIEKPELQLLPAEVICEIFRAVVRDNFKK